jgi:hypothetical protein
MRQRHPNFPWEVGKEATGANTQTSLSVRSGNQVVVLTPTGAPLPKDDALWERAALTWSDARQAAARHRAHISVSIKEASMSELERARLITAVVGSLIYSLPESCAVIWIGKVGRSPQMWQEMSQRSFAPHPNYPLLLWMDILPFKSGPGAGALTAGLSQFTGREIEFDLPDTPLATVIQWVDEMAFHLIEHGTIEDGQTLQLSGANRVKVRHGVSRFNGSPVLTVGPVPSAGSFKHYPIISLAAATNSPLLILLNRIGLFDAASSSNQVHLQPARYDSEERLDTYDQGVNGVLSGMQASDAYVAAEKTARTALANGDAETAKAALRPFAEGVRELQSQLQHGLARGDVFLFLPKQTPTKLG